MEAEVLNYYEYFDSLSKVELEEELKIIEQNKIDVSGLGFIDNNYIIALYDYLEDNAYFN